MPNQMDVDAVTCGAPDRAGADRLLIGVVCLAQLAIFLDVMVITVALPSISREWSLTAAQQQWAINAYVLPFAALLLPAGRLADRLDRRWLFGVSVAVFTLASLLGGLATSPAMLFAARATQGVAAAVLAPLTLTILTATSSVDRHPAVLALWSAMGSVGAIGGSLLGGIATEVLGWRSVLLINVPIGVVVVAAAVPALRALPAHGAGRSRFDVVGAAAGLIALGGVVLGVAEAGERGWTDPVTLGALGAGALGVAAFVVSQRADDPDRLLPAAVIGRSSVRWANSSMTLLGAGFFTSFYFLTLYLQDVLGLSPLWTGVAFVPGCLALLAATRAVGPLLRRYPVGRVGAAGAVVVAIGFGSAWGLLRPSVGVAGPILVQVVVSAGVGLAFTPVTLLAIGGVPPQLSGAASAVLNANRQVTGSVALAVLNTVAVAVTSHASASGADRPHAATTGFVAVFAVVAVSAVLAAPAVSRAARTG